MLSVFTREWLEVDVAIVGRLRRRPRRRTTARETLDATGRYVVPGFVDAHMHLESSKLLVGRVRAARAAARHDRGRRRPARDRQRARHRRRALAARRLRRPAARRLLHGVVVRARVARSSRRGAPLSPGDLEALLRRRRVIGLAEMMNFPGVIARRRARAREARAAGAEHVDGHAPGVLGKRAERLRGGRDPLRPRGLDARGGPRAAARRDVAADPRGLGGAEPAGAAAARAGVRPDADRVLHRRPRARAHRRGRAHQLDGARRGRGRASRPRTRSCWRRSTRATWHGLAPPRRDRARLPGRPAAAPRPRALRARDSCSSAAGRSARSTRRRRARLGQAHRARRRTSAASDFAHPLERRRGARDRRDPGPDRDRVARRGADASRTATASPTPSATSRRSPSSSGTSAPAGSALGLVRGFGLRRGALASTLRARRAQHRRRRHERRTTWRRAVARLAELGGGDRRRRRTAACSPSCRCPSPGCSRTRRSPRSSRRAAACVEAARELGCKLAAPFQSLAFLALSVIPALKITDRGLVDVDALRARAARGR